MPTLKNTIIIYNTLLIINFILFTIFFINFTYTSYYYFLQNNFFDFNNILKNFKTSESVITLLVFWCKNYLLKFVVIVIVLFIIKTIIKKIRLYSTIQEWDNEQDINPILARLLVSHFRHNKSITMQDFVSLYDYSRQQLQLLDFHKEKNKINSFMKKYDMNLEKDSK